MKQNFKLILRFGKFNALSLSFYLLPFTFVTLPTTTIAQLIQWEWIIHAGGGGDDYGKSLVTNDNGNILITGSYNSIAFFGDTIVQSPNYNPGIFISMLDSVGNFIWTKDDYSLNTTYSSSIISDIDGNVFVVGDFSDTLRFDTFQIINNKVSLNSFILKLNQYGNPALLTSLVGTNTVYGIDIGDDAFGNVFVGGIFLDTIYYESTSIIAVDSWDTYIIKINNIGELIWLKSINGPSAEGLYSLEVDFNNDLIIAGTYITSADFDDTTIISSGNVDVFIAKYLSSGELDWVRSIGEPATDACRTVTIDCDNNIFCYGIFMNTITFGDTSLTTSDYDVFITKLNPSGDFLWAKKISMYFSTGDEGYQHNMVCDNENNLYVTGWFMDTLIFDDYTLISTGGYDSFVFKVDPDGNPLWAMQITGSSHQFSRSIDIDNSGNLYITGRIHGSAYFDTVSVSSYGGADVFIAKLHEEPVSVSYNETNSMIEVSVYPNPATDFVNISTSGQAQSISKAEIVGLNGNIIRTYAGNLQTLDVSGLANGIYLLKLYEEKSIFVTKIVVK